MSAAFLTAVPPASRHENIYQPDLMEVIQVRQQTSDVKSVRIRFIDDALVESFTFRVGQFGMFSLFGLGESTFNICSSSTWKGFLEFCFRKTGRVTEGLWQLQPGDVIGFRGPYGNGYPMRAWEGQDLIFVGGGIAMPPIRCAIWYALEHRERYGRITIVYGARTENDLVFRDELQAWSEIDDVRVVRCVDPGGETTELGRRGRIRADGAGACRRGCPPCRGPGHRAARHDPIHTAGAGQDGTAGRQDLHQSREPDEVRRGEMWTLQLRPVLCLQRRPRAHDGAAETTARRLLNLAIVIRHSSFVISLRLLPQPHGSQDAENLQGVRGAEQAAGRANHEDEGFDSTWRSTSR